MFTITPTATLLAWSLLAQPAAPDPITPEQVRQAVQRSLPFLKTEGVKWIRDRQCMSCHHVPFMVWGLNEAQRHRFRVDRDELVQWSEWALRYGTYQAVFYQLNEATFAALEKAGMPADKLAELKQIKKTFATWQDFHQELVKVVSAKTLTLHQVAILSRATLPGQGGKGEDKDGTGPGIVAAELLLGGAPSLTSAPAEATQALVERLLKTQLPDGSWKHGGQLDALHRPARESTEVNTAWNLIALSSLEEPSDRVRQSRDRALAFLKDAKPGDSIESYVVHILLAHRRGGTERAKGLLRELLDQQLPDGGWSWRKGNPHSDAFATGEVLYVLGILGRPHTDPSVQRAWTFLFKTQRADGTWLVSSAGLRKNGPKASTDPIFTYWGTAWAAIGLLRTLPQ